MSSGVMRVLQPIVTGVETAVAVGVGVADALAVTLGDSLGLPLAVGEGVGTQPLSAASARADTARGTTARVTMRRNAGMTHCHPLSLDAARNTPAR